MKLLNIKKDNQAMIAWKLVGATDHTNVVPQKPPNKRKAPLRNSHDEKEKVEDDGSGRLGL